MRSTISLLLIVAVVLGIAHALSANDGASNAALDQVPTTAKNSGDNTLRSLRIGHSDDKSVEGRMLLNYSSLKKFIPGTSAYKAKKAAQEEEIQRLFKLPFSFLSNRKATFAKWRNAGKTPKQVKKGLRAGDTVTHDGAKRFANQYAEYLKTLK